MGYVDRFLSDPEMRWYEYTEGLKIEGAIDRSFEVAERMLSKGFDIEITSEMSGLDEESVRKIKEEMDRDGQQDG